MNFRTSFTASALAAALLLPLSAPASAQEAAPTAAAPTIQVGATVKDPQGGEVGRVTSVDGEFVVVQTDRHAARLPVSSFTPTEEAVLFGLTRDQLNGQLDQAIAQAQASIAVGAMVHDREGAQIGPIQAVDAETVTVQVGEQPVRLPRSSVAPGQSGLRIGATLAELQAQLPSAATPQGGDGAGSDGN